MDAHKAKRQEEIERGFLLLVTNTDGDFASAIRAIVERAEKHPVPHIPVTQQMEILEEKLFTVLRKMNQALIETR